MSEKEQKKSAILIEAMPDPTLRQMKAKKEEKKKKRVAENLEQIAGNYRQIFNQKEAEISLNWMQQFEIMHQNRMDLLDSNKSLAVDVAVKQHEIDCLKNGLANSVKNMDKVMRVLNMQQYTILKLQKMMEVKSKLIRRLRLLNYRKKKIISDQKKAVGERRHERNDKPNE